MSGAVAGFVQGLFEGANWREGRDDRARKRKIEDEKMGWDRQRFGWETEDAAYNRKTRAMELQKAQQAADDDAARRKLGRDFAAEMDREIQAQQSPISAPEPAQDVRVPASSLPFGNPGQTGTRGLGFSILGDAVQGGTGQTAMSGDPGRDVPGQIRRPAMSLLDSANSFLNRAPSSGSPPLPAAKGGEMVRDQAGNPIIIQPPRIEDQAPGRPANAPREMSILAPDPNHQFDIRRPAGLLGDLGELAARGSDAIRLDPGAIASGAANLVNRTINPVTRYAAGYEFPLVADAPFGPNSQPTSAPPQPAAAQPAQATRRAEPPAAQQSALSFGAPRTSEGTPMASLSLGREMGLIGRDGPVKTTKAMTQKAGEQFERAYLREYAPKMARLYVEQGDPEKAKLWMEWINDKNVKEGLKAWAKAGHAFSVGDAEGFLDYLAESFNVQGYADNGYSVNRSKSNFTHADNGDILGAQITWIDNATGREFTQNIEGINDLMAVGWGMLAPEKQFELGWEATIGAKKVKPKSIDPAKLMEAIEARKLSDPEFAKLTSDEQEAIMVQAFQRISLGTLGRSVTGTANNPVNPFD